MPMPTLTNIYALLLIILGVAAYLITGQESITALIPSFFGVVFLILGILAGIKETWRKHVMHAASVLALLAILGTAKSTMGVIAMLSGGEVDRPGAAVTQFIMLVLSAAFLGLCVNSFIQARRNRESEAA